MRAAEIFEAAYGWAMRAEDAGESAMASKMFDAAELIRQAIVLYEAAEEA